jgi:hypothetical protein
MLVTVFGSRRHNQQSDSNRQQQAKFPTTASRSSVRLFHLMRDMYLDKLAMAGGQGSKLLRRIKYEALSEYRFKNGWDDRRHNSEIAVRTVQANQGRET